MKKISKTLIVLLAVIALTVSIPTLTVHAQPHYNLIQSSDEVLIWYPSSGNYRIWTDCGEAIVSMFSDSSGTNCLWSSDWSNMNTNNDGVTYWVGSDVKCIKIRTTTGATGYGYYEKVK